MKVEELKHNLYLVDFAQVEREILYSIKKEIDKYGILTLEDLPKSDYTKLINYFTLFWVCKVYNDIQNKKNTIIFVNELTVDPDILKFIKEIKKHFPILLYTTKMQWDSIEPAVKTEITIRLKEFRYGIDFSKYSFNKIKKFCNKFGLDSLIAAYKP